MKIYIGFDLEKRPMGVLLSDSKEKAEIAWTAMEGMPHSIEEIDPATAGGVNGLVFLLTTTKVDTRSSYEHRDSDAIFRVWHRGIPFH